MRNEAADTAEGSDLDARHHHRRRYGRSRADFSMITKYAIALIVVILFAVAFRWSFVPTRYLPGNRARHLRIRLHLRLHPGKGFAHVFSLWLRWGRLAM